MKKIMIDPVTRIEGHLSIELEMDRNVVKEARTVGPMFRGIELILRGRHPLDASRITQRICGVCPTSHSLASATCLDDALDLREKIPENGILMRNILLGCNFLQSHILHFFHLSALDYINTEYGIDAGVLKKEWGPFFPAHKSDYKVNREDTLKLLTDYIKALDIRRQAHEMQAIFGGKMPHQVGIIAGGASLSPTADKIADFIFRLKKIEEFVDNCYIPDVLLVAGCYPEYWKVGISYDRFLSYGGLDDLFSSGMASSGTVERFDPEHITESVRHSRYRDTEERHPKDGQTVPDTNKKEAYSWLKAPRYKKEPAQVGPSARLIVNHLNKNGISFKETEAVFKANKLEPAALNSVLGRHLARALETRLVLKKMNEWILRLEPDKPVSIPFKVPEASSGYGLVEAPRGALGHWITIKDGLIHNYQCVVPTTWNASPKDDRGQNGPIERALIGCTVEDADNPVEPLRIVRSFDPCLACAVHIIEGKERRSFRVL